MNVTRTHTHTHTTQICVMDRGEQAKIHLMQHSDV